MMQPTKYWVLFFATDDGGACPILSTCNCTADYRHMSNFIGYEEIEINTENLKK